MKIKIDSIKENSSIVYFSCMAGQGIGIWKSRKLPINHNIYSIEIGIDKMLEELDFKEQVFLDKEILFEANNKVVLSVQVEDVEDDGMCFLRLSSDCLIMVDSQQKEQIKGRFLKISLSPEEINLYPTDPIRTTDRNA